MPLAGGQTLNRVPFVSIFELLFRVCKAYNLSLELSTIRAALLHVPSSVTLGSRRIEGAGVRGAKFCSFCQHICDFSFKSTRRTILAWN